MSDTEVNEAKTPAVAAKGTASYAIVALVAGLGLLAGGVYAYDHLPGPTPTGYTWMAWTGLPRDGQVGPGASAKELRFQIFHHQSDTTTFRLTAVWQGSTASQSLAKPLTLSIGPNQTFQGTLSVPPLPPDGCTYRIVVALTATRQMDPLTKKPQTWSIDADVQAPGKRTRTCN
jgi:hypothetical protein